MKLGESALTNIGLAAIAVVLIGSIGAATVMRSSPEAMTDTDTCGSAWHGKTTVILLDASNPLTVGAEATVREVVAKARTGVRGSRVVIARMSGARTYRPQILFDRCDPGGGAQADLMLEGPAAREALREEVFLAPLDAQLEKLVEPVDPNGESYIGETIMRAAADPAFHLDGEGARLVVVSDFIESTAISKPYQTGQIVLPKVDEPFLAGIAVTMVELPAVAGATSIQTFALRTEWRQWLADAQATDVQMISPGLAGSRRH